MGTRMSSTSLLFSTKKRNFWEQGRGQASGVSRKSGSALLSPLGPREPPGPSTSRFLLPLPALPSLSLPPHTFLCVCDSGNRILCTKEPLFIFYCFVTALYVTKLPRLGSESCCSCPSLPGYSDSGLHHLLQPSSSSCVSPLHLHRPVLALEAAHLVEITELPEEDQ